MSDTSEVGHARATSCVKCPSILSWLSFPSGAVTAVSHLPAEDQQPLPAVGTAYPTPPFLPVSHPPIELERSGPSSRLNLDRRLGAALAGGI